MKFLQSFHAVYNRDYRKFNYDLNLSFTYYNPSKSEHFVLASCISKIKKYWLLLPTHCDISKQRKCNKMNYLVNFQKHIMFDITINLCHYIAAWQY